MGIINDLGLGESMTKEQISEQLFNVRKKLINRQNSADAGKRTAAESQLAVLSSLQNAIDNMSPNFPNVQIIVGTYGYAVDNGKLNKDLKIAIEGAVAGNGNFAADIADFLGNNGQKQLSNKWLFWAANCGTVKAYQGCGYLLTDTDPDEAIKWFEKANQANAIGIPNIYNWGLIFYRKKEYAKAREKFERASAGGHSMAPHFIAEMYENGYGVTKDLHKALEQYRLAKQRGFQNAQQGITRVSTELNKQNATNTNVNPQNNNATGTPQNSNPHNGQPTLVYKSDKKSPISKIKDINIGNQKDKVKVDRIAGKVGGFADNVVGKVENISGGKADKEKIKNSPKVKILIGLVVLLVLMGLLRSCAVTISSGAKKTRSNNSSAQVAEELNKQDFGRECESFSVNQPDMELTP